MVNEMDYEVKEDLHYGGNEFKKGDMIDLPDNHRLFGKVKPIWEPGKKKQVRDGKPGKAAKKEEVNLDLNGDGKVDGKDASIGAKVMAAHKKNQKNKKKK